MMSRKKKVLEAYRAILGWLHQKGLRAGDRVPAQIPLGEGLGVSQGTLGAAMRLLVEDEVLDRRQKAGTVVRNLWPQNPHRRIWTAGIVMPEFGETGYHAALTMELHRELASRHFSDRTYFISPQSMPSSEVDVRRPSDFLGLENDLEEGLVDALLTSTRLLYENIPCVSLGSDPQSALRVIRDQDYFYESSVRELYARGCRKVFVVGESADYTKISQRAAKRLASEIEVVELPLSSINEWTVESAAENFLRQSSVKENCGIIISDDYAASIFSRWVVLNSSLRPVVCMQTYGASLLSYSLPALKYITDLKALSAAAVNMIVDRLLRLSTGQSEVRIPLMIREAEPLVAVRPEGRENLYTLEPR